MAHEKDKFILELSNYFRNYPSYSIGQCLYSLTSTIGGREKMFNMDDEEIVRKLEVTQLKESEN